MLASIPVRQYTNMRGQNVLPERVRSGIDATNCCEYWRLRFAACQRHSYNRQVQQSGPSTKTSSITGLVVGLATA